MSGLRHPVIGSTYSVLSFAFSDLSMCLFQMHRITLVWCTKWDMREFSLSISTTTCIREMVSGMEVLYFCWDYTVCEEDSLWVLLVAVVSFLIAYIWSKVVQGLSFVLLTGDLIIRKGFLLRSLLVIGSSNSDGLHETELIPVCLDMVQTQKLVADGDESLTDCIVTWSTVESVDSRPDSRHWRLKRSISGWSCQ